MSVTVIINKVQNENEGL